MEKYIRKIIDKFTTQKYSEKVTNKVHNWFLNSDHAEEKEAVLLELWNNTDGKVDVDTWASLESVYRKVGVSEKKEIKIRTFPIWKYVAAAIILVFISVSSTIFMSKSYYSEAPIMETFTSAGEMNTYILPDGSEVKANSNTILLYPEKFNGDTRTVFLVGEANFKVKKNSKQPFIVRSANVEVTALGTEFNVSAYPESDEIIATLLEGKVKVDCGLDKSYILHPGQQVTYNKKMESSVLSDVNIQDVIAWRTGQVVLRGNTMNEILMVLERRYAIRFQYNANLFNNDKYNLSLRQNSDIYEVMTILQKVVQGFDYSIEKGICYIKSKK